MLFYIKHEIIGDYMQQIAEGVNVRYVFLCRIVGLVSPFSMNHINPSDQCLLILLIYNNNVHIYFLNLVA